MHLLNTVQLIFSGNEVTVPEIFIFKIADETLGRAIIIHGCQNLISLTAALYGSEMWRHQEFDCIERIQYYCC
jgi:hypothetical protein